MTDSDRLEPPVRTNNTPGKDGDKWLTLYEVAEMLDVHPDTIKRWSELGVIRTHRDGHRGDRKFLITEIVTFLSDND